MSELCPVCKKPFHKRRKRMLEGKIYPIGRPKKRDDKLIRQLRKDGLSIRAIAHATGFSTAAVQRGLK